MHDRTIERQAALTLRRLRPRLAERFAAAREVDPAGWGALAARLDTHFGALFANVLPLYGGRYDFFYRLEELLAMAARSWFDRPAELRALDAAREADPGWFHRQEMMGGVCYVDLFAGDLAGVRAKIPYFRELGLTYLHLMPLFRAPEGNSDGGYAVSSYREVEPRLGTMAELADLAGELRREGISLVLDFVFNHTSDEHVWARAAATDPEGEDADGNPHGEYYWLFPDRTLPDTYQRTLREIFPDQRPGSFTFRPEIPPEGRWVWTTFNSFQ
ncbi:MAG: alpha-amylase family glycosyl hydrolase [Chloroflexota bacterium]|nr:alpha-amylase family glycosyl hydrolase [Chloroflexota bacterium]